jgi:CxxC-x17-CxxC domain-containing protein
VSAEKSRCNAKKSEAAVNKPAVGKMYSVACVNCGKKTEVPFEPTGGRKVYCKECYSLHERGQL